MIVSELINKFKVSKCKADLDLMAEIHVINYWQVDCFFDYIVVEFIVSQVWISEKGGSYLLEIRDRDYMETCREKYKVASREGLERVSVSEIVNSEEASYYTMIDSKKKLLKFLKRDIKDLILEHRQK